MSNIRFQPQVLLWFQEPFGTDFRTGAMKYWEWYSATHLRVLKTTYVLFA
jgi:hypothetical protein